MITNQKIHFNSEKVKVALTKKKKLKAFLAAEIELAGQDLHELSYVFVSDDSLLEMNRTHLNHDFYTDVITFDLSSSKTELLGDIYISIDRVNENAETEGTSPQTELHRVIFHGLLHLLGWDDKSAAKMRRMRAKEDEMLKRYFY